MTDESGRAVVPVPDPTGSDVTGPDSTGPEFDRRMLEALICPHSHQRLEYDASAAELISHSAGLAFPIRAGIPILLTSEARALD